ncbi:ABC transporter ATP-binding protein, partial [Streptomyces albidoflavus]
VWSLVVSLGGGAGVRAAAPPRPDGAVAEVRGEAASLQAAFLELVGAQDRSTGGTLDWLGGAR